jgi:hypothetical protein
MKVNGPSGVGAPATARTPSGTSGSGFSIASAEAGGEMAPLAPPAAPAGIGAIDALLALQGVGGPLERRRKAVGRAGRILDVLDEIKLALIGGEVTPAALHRLVGALHDERTRTDDPRLEGVLDEIETRAAVELAKLELSQSAA